MEPAYLDQVRSRVKSATDLEGLRLIGLELGVKPETMANWLYMARARATLYDTIGRRAKQEQKRAAEKPPPQPDPPLTVDQRIVNLQRNLAQRDQKIHDLLEEIRELKASRDELGTPNSLSEALADLDALAKQNASERDQARRERDEAKRQQEALQTLIVDLSDEVNTPKAAHGEATAATAIEEGEETTMADPTTTWTCSKEHVNPSDNAFCGKCGEAKPAPTETQYVTAAQLNEKFSELTALIKGQQAGANPPALTTPAAAPIVEPTHTAPAEPKKVTFSLW